MQGQEQDLKCQAGDKTLLSLTLGIKSLYRSSPRLPEHISQLTSLRYPGSFSACTGNPQGRGGSLATYQDLADSSGPTAQMLFIHPC